MLKSLNDRCRTSAAKHWSRRRTRGGTNRWSSSGPNVGPKGHAEVSPEVDPVVGSLRSKLGPVVGIEWGSIGCPEVDPETIP